MSSKTTHKTDDFQAVIDLVNESKSIESQPAQPEKKSRGNPNMIKGGASLNPTGRPKGSKNTSTMLLNALKEHDVDYFAELARLMKSGKIQDTTKLNKLVEMLPYITPRLKFSESESTNNNNFTITFKTPDNPDTINEGEFIVEGEIQEAELLSDGNDGNDKKKENDENAT